MESAAPDNASDSPEAAKEILDSMLGYLGFVAEIEIDRDRPDPSLLVTTAEPKSLIGRGGERLDDIQYLVNRILQVRSPKAARVRVDIDHYRAQQEDRMLEEAEELAARVVSTGEPGKLPPMNSYHRRIVHNHFVDHPEVKTWSPPDSARLKRITILPRGGD